MLQRFSRVPLGNLSSSAFAAKALVRLQGECIATQRRFLACAVAGATNAPKTGKRCAIVGAGVSGLPAARWALAYGYEPVIFEATDQIGGLWVYKPGETALSSVMRTTVINTSKEMTAFSDFPPLPTDANFMHNRQLRRYFNDYAVHHGLVKHVRFNNAVTGIERASDYEASGKWSVDFKDQTGTEQNETFDCVLMCNGHHAKPHIPTPWKGQENFKGRVLHVHSYKNADGYQDSRVIVVGIGNSAVDVAVEMSRIAQQTWLSTRRGAWIMHKYEEGGVPFDFMLNRWWTSFLKKLLPMSVFTGSIQRSLNKRFDHALFGVKPQHHILAQHPTVNDDLPNRIMSGLVQVKPNISRFEGEKNVVFEDGSVAENVDHVILSTGYLIEFPLLENGKLITVSRNEVEPMYKNMWPVKLARHNTLAAIGMCQPVGSLMPLSEMQARCFFDVLTGNTKLPSAEAMLVECADKKRALQARYVPSLRHTIQVDYVEYMHELATLIGVNIGPLGILFKYPSLFLRSVFGPWVPYYYRLQGSHPWGGAKHAIETLQERVEKPTRTRQWDAPLPKQLNAPLN